MISIVIPTLNEEANIGRLLESITEVYPKGGIEVVVTDGNSTDRTQEIVRSFSSKFPYIRLVLQNNRGFASALSEGITAAKGDVIVTMDAENHMPSEISKLVSELEVGGFDVVVGSRFVKGSDVDLERKRLLSSKIANKIARVALELKVQDCSSGFRAYRAWPVKQAVKDLRTKYFSVQVEILEKISKNGGKLGEIPVHYLKRDGGESKFRFKAAVSDATTLIKIARDNEIGKIKKTSQKIMNGFTRKSRKVKK